MAKMPTALQINTAMQEGDVAELLPPAAAAVFRDLRQKLADLRALRMATGDEVDFHRTSKIAAEARERQLKLARGAGGPGLDDGDLQVQEVQRAIERHAAEMKRMTELNAARDAISMNLSRLFNRCEDFIRHRPRGTRIVEVPQPEIATVLKRNETPATALDRLRLRLRELAADLHRVNSAPYPSAYAKTRVRQMVEMRAQAPDLGGLIEHDAEIRWPVTTVDLPLIAIGQNSSPVHGSARGEVIDMLAVLAWFDKPRLLDMLDAEIDDLADDGEAFSHEERQEKLAEIEVDRIAIERQECAVIKHMQREGMAVEFRSDTDPKAVLSVELETVVSNDAAAGRPSGMAAAAVIEVHGG